MAGFTNDIMECNGYISNPLTLDIVANTNDLDIQSTSCIVITNTTGGSLNITGCGYVAEGFTFGIYNSSTSTGNVVLKYNDASSSSDNRFKNFTGVDITLTPGKYFRFFYLEGFWR